MQNELSEKPIGGCFLPIVIGSGCGVMAGVMLGVLIVVMRKLMPIIIPKMMGKMMPMMMEYMRKAQVEPPCAQIIRQVLEQQQAAQHRTETDARGA